MRAMYMCYVYTYASYIALSSHDGKLEKKL